MRNAMKQRAWPQAVTAISILLIAASLSPFALADTGLFPHQFFYVLLMPILVLRLLFERNPRINPYLGSVILVEIAILLLVMLVGSRADAAGYAKTIATLLSVSIVCMLVSSGLLDSRIFVHVAVIATIVVLILAAVSFVLAYLGYATPVERFARPSGVDEVYQVGYTLTSRMYPAGQGWFIRPGGVFAEPGQMAMHTSLAMMANATVLQNNRLYERLLIVFGLFTTSLAFYLFLPIYFVLFKRRALLVLYLGGFALAVLLAGGQAVIEEDILLTHVLGRVLGFFTDTLGGNRAAPTFEIVTKLGHVPLLGPAPTDVFQGLDADATIFGPFLLYGWIGSLCAYLHVIMFAVVPFLVALQHYPRRPVHTWMIAIFILLALNLFQRPFTLNFLYYVYLAVMFDWEWRKYAATSPPAAVAA